MSNSPRPKWKPSEVSLLRSLVDVGQSDDQISTALGTRSGSQVSAKRLSLGIKTTRTPGRPRKYRIADVEAIRDRIVAGEHINAVAADLGLQPRTLYARLRMLSDTLPA